jgi:pimeloyl-ACP methyl ester carboxylesterase
MPTTTAPSRRRHGGIRTATRFLTAALGAAAALGLFTAPAAHADTPSPTACHDVSVPVSLGDGTAAQIAGTLCVPEHANQVLVLIPGITYTRAYWDFPLDPATHSFSKAANAQGLATFALDKLGTGASTRPASTEVTVPNTVDTVHQVVQALRHGQLGTSFRQVALVGHSYGSLVAYTTAGMYPGDADVLVTTGIAHTLNLATTIGEVILPGRPAALDPKFGGTIVDPGYLTTSPGERPVFYHQSTVDPAVVAEDEKLKDTFTIWDFLTFVPQYLNSASHNYNGPVFVINGTADQIMCGTPPIGAPCNNPTDLANAEKPFYGPGATVTGAVVPDTGHDLTLSTTAPGSTRLVLDWLRTTLDHH